MELQINPYSFGERPQVTPPTHQFYTVLGEEGIRKLVSRHYDLLRTSSINSLFPATNEGFEMAKKNSADFMIQICGGPAYFNQNRGVPKLINRHAGFSIDKDARIVWLNCYKQALLELEVSNDLILSFWNYINIFSSWMVNTENKSL
jgi:hemoglobin